MLKFYGERSLLRILEAEMKKKVKKLLIFILINTFFILILSGCKPNAQKPFARSNFLLGTTVDIMLYDSKDSKAIDEAFDRIREIENKMTINTMVTTALIRASGELCDVGMAASIREKGFTGMGNYATGISIKYKYNEKNSFAQNARVVQKMIYDKLNDTSKRYFLLQFMRSIEPTLIDAIYFNACSDYNNKTAETFSKMFGYSGNPKGISITNLTRLPIEANYGEYEIIDFVFVPPLVLNAKRIIGIATIGKKMVLSLHLNNDSKAEEHRKFFSKGMEYLKNL